MSIENNDYHMSDEYLINVLDAHFGNVAEKEKKVRKKADNKSEVKVTARNPLDDIPMLDVYSSIGECAYVMITVEAHNIEYKGSYWPIAQREIRYAISMIKASKRAKDASDFMHGESEFHRKEASEGKVRYYEISSRDDSTLHKIKDIGRVMVYTDPVSGKLRFSVKLNSSILRSNHVDLAGAKKRILRAMDMDILHRKRRRD